MTQKNKIIFLLIIITVALLTFVSGFLISAKIFKSQCAPTTAGLLEDKVLEIKRQLLDDLRTEQLLPPLPKEFYELDGKVVSVSKDSLVLEPKKDKGLNPLGLTFPNTLKILFSENTAFYNADWKPKEQYDRERQEYSVEIEKREQAEESLDGLIPPDIMSYVNIQDTDLNVGDYVHIVSEDNILDKEKIEAKEVQVLNKIVEDNPFLK